MKKQKEEGKIHTCKFHRYGKYEKERIYQETVRQEKGKNIPNRIYTPTFMLDNFKL